jgi:hypothetical protein
VYHDELFLNDGYVSTFLSMKNLTLNYPQDDFGFSIEHFRFEVAYESQSCKDVHLPMRFRYLTRTEYLRTLKRQQCLQDDEDLSLIESPAAAMNSQVSEDSDEEDAKYPAITFYEKPITDESKMVKVSLDFIEEIDS